MSNYVWVVTGIDAHFNDILGIFDSEEKAYIFRESHSEDLNDYAYINITKRELE